MVMILALLMQCSQNLMRVRFCTNAGIMQVHFLLNGGIMKVLKAKNAGISLRKCGYYAGISKCAIPFPPFLCIQNCSLSTPFIS